eukprot:scaffold5774_cov67-Phaeocystis_antarctica.AAC.2
MAVTRHTASLYIYCRGAFGGPWPVGLTACMALPPTTNPLSRPVRPHATYPTLTSPRAKAAVGGVHKSVKVKACSADTSPGVLSRRTWCALSEAGRDASNPRLELVCLYRFVSGVTQVGRLDAHHATKWRRGKGEAAKQAPSRQKERHVRVGLDVRHLALYVHHKSWGAHAWAQPQRQTDGVLHELALDEGKQPVPATRESTRWC